MSYINSGKVPVTASPTALTTYSDSWLGRQMDAELKDS